MVVSIANQKENGYVFYGFGLALFAIPFLKVPYLGLTFSALTCLYYFGVIACLVAFKNLPDIRPSLSFLDLSYKRLESFLVVQKAFGALSAPSFKAFAELVEEITLLPLQILLRPLHKETQN